MPAFLRAWKTGQRQPADWDAAGSAWAVQAPIPHVCVVWACRGGCSAPASASVSTGRATVLLRCRCGWPCDHGVPLSQYPPPNSSDPAVRPTSSFSPHLHGSRAFCDAQARGVWIVCCSRCLQRLQFCDFGRSAVRLSARPASLHSARLTSILSRVCSPAIMGRAQAPCQ